MQRYILTHDIEGSKTLEYAPEGWNDLKYTVTRNKSYHGLFRSFSGSLRFVKDGKDFIDNIINTYGFETTIDIEIYELDQSTRIWGRKVNGILNFDPNVYVTEENYTEVNFEDSVIHKKFKNRETLDIAYNRKETLDGTILPGFSDETITVELRGQGTDTGDSTCVFPFEAFNRVIQVICDLDYNPVISSVFGRPNFGYVENGKAAMVTLTKGLLMRGFTLGDDNTEAGETNLNFQLKDLFENFDKLFNLGLGSEWDSVNKRWNFVIEDKGYFYQTSELFTLENISNLKYSYDDELMYQKISTGYRKFEQENSYGLSEYNNQLEFTTPISVSDKKLDITSSYRADGTAFQIAIDNRYSGTEENETNIDEDIFFVHAFNDEGTYKSVKNENFNLITGLYGLDPIIANVYISPARNMMRWGEIIRSSLGMMTDKKVRFNKAENLSNLSSQYSGEIETIFENRDVDIDDLKTPRFSGRKIEFDAPLTRAQIDIITGNPYGLVKFYDYINKEYNYGWIKECSTDRVDRDTTWALFEAANLDEVSNNLVYMDGEDILLMDNSTTIKVLA